MIKIGNEINLNKKDPYNLNININICSNVIINIYINIEINSNML